MSLGVSPSNGSSFPSPPLGVGSLPRGGGILINKSDDAQLRLSSPTSPNIDLPSAGPSPTTERRLSFSIPEQNVATPMGGNVSSASQRIRFAPLPNPIRPRSLSTGDPTWSGEQEHQTVLVKDVKGYDNALESEDDDDDDYHKRGRRWSKSMGMGVDWGSGWKGTKKILTMGLIGDEETEYADGAPLKKSVSTGGFIGSSPFRWTSETERKKTMLGTSPSSTTLQAPSRESSTHRRGSSAEINGLVSPAGKQVKLLNGRVYGSRRASEAAQAQKTLREKNEPEFVEWGHGRNGGGMGSNQPSKPLLGEDDDGSGMDWVRKRKMRREQEEREKQEREARESAIESGGESDSSESQKANPGPITPSVPSSELPPPPIIQVSEHLTPYDSAPGTLGGPMSPNSEKATNPIGIMAGKRSEDRDVFDEDDEEDGRKRGDSSDDSDEEEDEDEGDFSDDEEEEEAPRTTSTAAGVEKVSRHREQNQPPAIQV